MTTLVTGANGFTGSHVVHALLRRGRKVHGYVRVSSDLQRLKNLPIPLTKGDITDREILRVALRGIDTVIHTAAYVALGIVNGREMQRVNVEGTRALLEMALEAGIQRFVHCSTIGVLGDTQGMVVDESFQRRQSTFSSAYDQTKFQAQELADRFHTHGLPVVSVLPSGILGLGDPHFGPIVRRFLDGRLKLWAGGARITGIVHVEDVAEALVLAAEKGDAGQRYIASAGELTTHQIFEIMAAGTGIPPPREVPKPLMHLVAQCLDPMGKLFSFNPPVSRERLHYLYNRCIRVNAAKARRELGWNPLTPEQTVQTLIP